MVSEPAAEDVVAVLLDRHGRTFSSEAGIRLRDTPSPLFRLLCLALLASARIGASQATRAARALGDAGWTTAQHMADSSWEQRVTVLNEHGYARYDESTAGYLGDATDLLVDRYQGDLRRLRAAAEHDPETEHRLLQEFKGIGEVGAQVFTREAQLVWSELEPRLDDRARQGAEALGLPGDADELRTMVDDVGMFVRLVAALVRSQLAGDSDEIVADAAER